MRIRGWTIDRFAGLSQEKQRGVRSGLIVVYGPNESGKSTLMRGLVGALFGFDRGAARVGEGVRLVVEARDGRIWTVRRNVGARRPEVRAADDSRIDFALFERELLGIDMQLFRRYFAFGADSETTVELANDAQLNAALADAGGFGPNAGLLRSMNRWRDSAAVLHGKSGRSHLLATAAEHRAAVSRVREAQERANEAPALCRALAEVDARIAQWTSDIVPTEPPTPAIETSAWIPLLGLLSLGTAVFVTQAGVAFETAMVLAAAFLLALVGFVCARRRAAKQNSRHAQDAASANEKRARRDAALIELGRQRQESSARLSGLYKSADVARATAHREAMAAELRRSLCDYRALKLARAVVIEAERRERAKRLPEILEIASLWFEALTEGRYSIVDVDDRGAFFVVDVDGETLAAQVLSLGAREQLRLAIRLAVIDTLGRRGVDLPLFFDDALVNADDHRAAAAARVIARFSRTRQVFFFTCRKSIFETLTAAAEGAATVIHRESPSFASLFT